MDLKKWCQEEFDEGTNAIKATKQILSNRINELNNNGNIYNIPKVNDFYITRFTKHSLQIQNTLNCVFQLGQTYQQNANNRQFISLKINKNPQNNVNNIRMRNGNNNNNSTGPKDKRALDFSASPFGIIVASTLTCCCKSCASALLFYQTENHNELENNPNSIIESNGKHNIPNDSTNEHKYNASIQHYEYTIERSSTDAKSIIMEFTAPLCGTVLLRSSAYSLHGKEAIDTKINSEKHQSKRATDAKIHGFDMVSMVLLLALTIE